MSIVYLDASALVKLAIKEEHSDAIVHHVSLASNCATSIVGRIELERAVRQRHNTLPKNVFDRLSNIFDGITIVDLDIATAAVASKVVPERLRTLDAIHLATMIALETDLDHCCCYDIRLSEAVQNRGIRVISPQ